MLIRTIVTILFFFLTLASFVSVNSYDINDEEKTYEIEVKGAVKNPGVYEVKKGETIEDVLMEAILLDDADTSSLNLTRSLCPYQVIVVGQIAEEKKISINSATIEELDTLTGIGKATAEKIIEYRERNGGFSYLEEIMEVSGIKEKTYAKIKDKISL